MQSDYDAASWAEFAPAGCCRQGFPFSRSNPEIFLLLSFFPGFGLPAVRGLMPRARGRGATSRTAPGQRSAARIIEGVGANACILGETRELESAC